MSTELDNANSSSKQIRYGALLSYASIFINIIAGILYTPWMIKQIGQADYGLYSLSLSIIGFFTIDFGLGESVARFLSKYNIENQHEKKKDFLGITFKLYLVIDILILISLVIIYLFAGKIYAELTVGELEKFRVVFIIASFYAIGSFPFQPLKGILISHEQFVFSKTMDVVHRILTVSTLIIVLLMGFRLYALVIVNAVTGFITIGLKLYYVFNKKLIDVNLKAWNYELLKEVFSFSVWISIIVIAQRFIFNITPTVLAAFSGSEEIALFSIASTMEGYVWFIAAALNGLFLPKVTKLLHVNNSLQEIQRLMIKVGRIQLIIFGLIFSGFLTLGEEFIELWLGSSFASAYLITILLISPSMFTLTQQIGNTVLVAKNLVKYQSFGVIITSLVSIILSLLLSSKYGALGAGIAIFTGTLFGSVIIMNLVYSKILNINVITFFRECHLKIISSIIITIIIGFIVRKFIFDGGWLMFLIKAGIVALTYILSIWNMALNNYEKGLFLNAIKKLRKRS